MKPPRLDILIYAHDGRGLGHASRSIGIGMALRRLYPQLRVLFVSGCRQSQELIGGAPLDWLKLPSYETEVAEGRSRGVSGYSMFSDHEQGELRAAQLAQIVSLYRPRLVLADHTPQGKHRELLQALGADGARDTFWLLGVRGVVGAVPQARSAAARQVFTDHYRGLIWYGDSAVLGDEHPHMLEQQYGVQPVECGYVSRLRELRHVLPGDPGAETTFAGTVSVPWLGEHTLAFLRTLAGALTILGPEHGPWRLFVELGGQSAVRAEIEKLFGRLPHCRLEAPSGLRYVQALLASRSAVIYGGYNSIMDVLALNLPAVVVLRAMQDNEQQIHMEKLRHAAGDSLQVVDEAHAEAGQLADLLLGNLAGKSWPSRQINLDGAEHAAGYLMRLLSGQADG